MIRWILGSMQQSIVKNATWSYSQQTAEYKSKLSIFALSMQSAICGMHGTLSLNFSKAFREFTTSLCLRSTPYLLKNKCALKQKRESNEDVDFFIYGSAKVTVSAFEYRSTWRERYAESVFHRIYSTSSTDLHYHASVLKLSEP